jgi:uncharacterized membrane protein
MNQHTTHPLVAAYLEELERLLAGIDPGDRAEVLSGVREHLDGSLPGHGRAGDDEVRTALAELGPPQAVADEAYAGRPAHAPTAPPRVGALSRPWVPVVVAILTGIGLLVVLVVTGSIGGVVTSTSVDSSGAVVETTAVGASTLFATFFAAIAMTLPVWVSVAVLVGLSSLWVGREKLIVAGLVPAAALLMAALPLLGWWIIGVNGVYAGAWAALAVVVVGGSWLMVRLTARAAARARRG